MFTKPEKYLHAPTEIARLCAVIDSLTVDGYVSTAYKLQCEVDAIRVYIEDNDTEWYPLY